MVEIRITSILNLRYVLEESRSQEKVSVVISPCITPTVVSCHLAKLIPQNVSLFVYGIRHIAVVQLLSHLRDITCDCINSWDIREFPSHVVFNWVTCGCESKITQYNKINSMIITDPVDFGFGGIHLNTLSMEPSRLEPYYRVILANIASAERLVLSMAIFNGFTAGMFQKLEVREVQVTFHGKLYLDSLLLSQIESLELCPFGDDPEVIYTNDSWNLQSVTLLTTCTLRNHRTYEKLLEMVERNISRNKPKSARKV